MLTTGANGSGRGGLLTPAALLLLGMSPEERGGAGAAPGLICQHWTGERDNSPKVTTRLIRAAGTSRREYQRPRAAPPCFRSHARGMSTSSTTVLSIRPPCRRTTWAIAQW